MIIQVGETVFTMADLAEIDFGARGVKEIVQNVYRLLLTPKYSCPLARLMGMTYDFVDSPISETPDLITAEVLDQINQYEPRAEIADLRYEHDAQNGKLIPIFRLTIHNVIYGTNTEYD